MKGDLIMKNSNSKLIFTAFLSFAVLFSTHAQQQAIKSKSDRMIETSDLAEIKGTVKACDKCYVVNAEVTAKKTGTKTYTDSFGRFEIIAPHGDVLIFKAKGFEKNRREITPYDDEITVNMNLKPGEKNKRIAVIYGHMNPDDITYAVEHYRRIDDDFLKYSDMRDLLRTELVGARVNDQSNIRVFVRGKDIGSFGIPGNNSAASFMLDGIIVENIDFLNPMDVKSVTLVKDAAGAGIYGSRGANGVVLINTKY